VPLTRSLLPPGVLALTALLAACDAGPRADASPTEAALTASGISLELAGHRAATVSELAYEIHLSVPRARTEPLAGAVALRFHWDDPAGLPFVIDLADPADRVVALEVNGEDVAEPRYADNHLVIPPGLLRRGERNEVVVALRAGDGPLNRQDDFLYTLFVPDRAHHALPLLDQPDLKARVTLSLEVPEGWEAVANGRRELDEPLADGRRRLTFAGSAPIPTYLIAFAAGEFERVEREVGGHPMVLYHRETDAERVADNLEAIFELHATALDWLEAYTGIPYPFDLFEFVAVPSFQYGGMEHPGAVSYRASSLFLEPSATQAQFLGRASLIAHETAHMWFGDLVTMRWFDDVWTKEVFANFYAAKIVNPSFPELDHDLRFLLAHHPRAYAVDRSRGANPIRQPLANLNEAGALYGAIIYQKAPVVMRQLERIVGEEAFQAGIRTYLERFSFANATWPELIEILDPFAEVDLGEWSRVWVEEPGRPVVEVVREEAGAIAAEGGATGWLLRQRDPGTSEGGAPRVWMQTLDPVEGRGHEVRSLGEVRVGDAPVRVAAGSAEERLGGEGMPGADSLRWLLPDGGGYGYARFRLDDVSRSALLEVMAELEAPLHRALVLLALHDAVLEEELPPTDVVELLVERAAHEGEEQLLSHGLGVLGSLYWTFLSPEERNAWAPRIEAVLLDRLSGNEGSTVKAALFGALRQVALTPPTLDVLKEVWAGERTFPSLVLGEEDRGAAAFALALREVDGWADLLDREEARIENPDRLARFRFLRPAVDADPMVREAFFESLRERENRAREPWVQTGLGYLNHPLRAEHGLRFLRPSLELLEEIQRTGDIFFPLGWMGAALAGHASPEAVQVVEGFLVERPDFPPRLREKVLQALDTTERAARLRGARCSTARRP
jgi:aminopeptidase N